MLDILYAGDTSCVSDWSEGFHWTTSNAVSCIPQLWYVCQYLSCCACLKLLFMSPEVLELFQLVCLLTLLLLWSFLVQADKGIARWHVTPVAHTDNDWSCWIAPVFQSPWSDLKLYALERSNGNKITIWSLILTSDRILTNRNILYIAYNLQSPIMNTLFTIPAIFRQ